MAKIASKNKKLILMILFTAMALLVWRLGTKIPVPLLRDIDTTADTSGSIFGFLDIFTGNALSSFSILALGISPYITSSIVIQLLQMDIVPKFKEWSEEGEAGKAKLNQWTRYIALLLAFVQALAILIGVNNSGYKEYYFGPTMQIYTYFYLALIMTAGTAFVMWLADQITSRGIGNGGSMMIVAGIIASIPVMFTTLIKTLLLAEDRNAWSITKFCVVIVMYLLVILAVIWMEGLQRKIPIQYANRPASASLRGKQGSEIPLKINSASVIPVIFASTLMSLPLTIVGFMQVGENAQKWWNIVFQQNQPIGFALYVILIFLFSFFYSYLQINPDKIADNLKKQNAYIAGVKPGEETAAFISKVLFKVTLLGATYLAILASLPTIIVFAFNLDQSISIGGTSIMIVVGVAIETAKQIKTQAQSQEYQGFL